MTWLYIHLNHSGNMAKVLVPLVEILGDFPSKKLPCGMKPAGFIMKFWLMPSWAISKFLEGRVVPIICKDMLDHPKKITPYCLLVVSTTPFQLGLGCIICKNTPVRVFEV